MSSVVVANMQPSYLTALTTLSTVTTSWVCALMSARTRAMCPLYNRHNNSAQQITINSTAQNYNKQMLLTRDNVSTPPTCWSNSRSYKYIIIEGCQNDVVNSIVRHPERRTTLSINLARVTCRKLSCQDTTFDLASSWLHYLVKRVKQIQRIKHIVPFKLNKIIWFDNFGGIERNCGVWVTHQVDRAVLFKHALRDGTAAVLCHIDAPSWQQLHDSLVTCRYRIWRLGQNNKQNNKQNSCNHTSQWCAPSLAKCDVTKKMMPSRKRTNEDAVSCSPNIQNKLREIHG